MTKFVKNPTEKPRDREASGNREENEIAELRAVGLMYSSLLGKSQGKTQELKRGTKS